MELPRTGGGTVRCRARPLRPAGRGHDDGSRRGAGTALGVQRSGLRHLTDGLLTGPPRRWPGRPHPGLALESAVGVGAGIAFLRLLGVLSPLSATRFPPGYPVTP